MSEQGQIGKEKALRLLGLARKAGAVQFGAEACEKMSRQGKTQLLLLASDAGQSTQSRFTHLSEQTGVELIRLGEAQELAAAIGKEKVVVIALSSRDFADGIKQAITSQAL